MYVVTIDGDPVKGFDTWFSAHKFQVEQQKSGAKLVRIYEIEYVS